MELAQKMNYLNHLVTDQVPSFFKNIPIPKTFGGFLDLKRMTNWYDKGTLKICSFDVLIFAVYDWARLVAITGAVGFASYISVQGIITMLPEHIIAKLPAPCKRGKHRRMNKCIEKDRAKCNHHIDIEELGDKTSFCRCWRSAKVREDLRTLLFSMRSTAILLKSSDICEVCAWFRGKKSFSSRKRCHF